MTTLTPQTPTDEVAVTEVAPETGSIELVRVLRGMQGPAAPNVDDIPDLATTFRNQLV